MPTRKSADLLTALATPPKHANKRDECLLITSINAQRPEEVKAVLAAIDNPRWSSRTLAGVLTENGVPVSAGAVQNHRRGMCPCYTGRPTHE